METKINFSANGINFTDIPVQIAQFGAYARMKGISKVISQYIKSKYGVPFQISSDSYSGGDSVTVYVSPLQVDRDTYQKIHEELRSVFQGGYFNSMEDIYETSKGDIKTTVKGKEVVFDTKYMFVNYYPKYGTKQHEEYQKSKECESCY